MRCFGAKRPRHEPHGPDLALLEKQVAHLIRENERLIHDNERMTEQNEQQRLELDRLRSEKMKENEQLISEKAQLTQENRRLTVESKRQSKEIQCLASKLKGTTITFAEDCDSCEGGSGGEANPQQGQSRISAGSWSQRALNAEMTAEMTVEDMDDLDDHQKLNVWQNPLSLHGNEEQDSALAQALKVGRQRAAEAAERARQQRETEERGRQIREQEAAPQQQLENGKSPTGTPVSIGKDPPQLPPLPNALEC